MTATGLLLAVVLLALNAFFVAAEFAAVSVRRAQIERLAERSARAGRVLDAQRRLSMLLAGAQFGITMCSLGLGAVAEPSLARLLEHGLHAAHLPTALGHPLAFAIALAVVVTLHLVLGEMVPKNLAIARPERSAVALVPVLDRFVRLTRPVITMMNGLANAVLRLLGTQPRDELRTAYTAGELSEIVVESRSQGLLADSEHDRLRRALAVAERTVGELLDAGPSVSPDEPGDAVERLAAGTGRSAFALVDGGTPIGWVRAIDAVRDPSTGAGALRRELPEVPSTLAVPDALRRLHAAHAPLAAVTRDGQRIGVVREADLLAELLGR